MKALLKVLSGQKANRVPVWLMRQAGRYLPEYRELRAQKGGFLEMAFDPQSACEVTMQPIRRFEMDGAIIFSDILTIPYALGQKLEFLKGEGPKLDPIEGEKDLAVLSFEKLHERLEPVYEALRLTRAQLSKEKFDQTTLIGFAGAPWTVATYMIEGGGSKDYMKTKALAYGNPEFFSQLIDVLVQATSEYLIKQIDAGAEVVKIFDSWAGVLDEEEFYRWAIEPIVKIIANVKQEHSDVPIIGFPRGAGLKYLSYMMETQVDACAIDSMVPLEWAAQELQPIKPLQGNLDPAILLAGGQVLQEKTKRILTLLGDQPFIFNLGHGINKETPIDHVEALIKTIREHNSV